MLLKDENLSLNPITHTEAGSSGKCLQPQHQERREMGMGVPGVQWPASLAKMMRSRFSKRAITENKVRCGRERHPTLTSGFYTHE